MGVGRGTRNSRVKPRRKGRKRQNCHRRHKTEAKQVQGKGGGDGPQEPGWRGGTRTQHKHPPLPLPLHRAKPKIKAQPPQEGLRARGRQGGKPIRQEARRTTTTQGPTSRQGPQQAKAYKRPAATSGRRGATQGQRPKIGQNRLVPWLIK